MAAHTKIIDFFGIPACGKSTLVDYISTNYQGELRIISKHQLVKEAKKQPVKLMFSLPLDLMLSGIKLRMSAPFDKKRNEIKILNWPSHARYYGYAKKHSNCDVVLVDHGDIQDFVSLERGDDLHETKRFYNACSQYIDKSLATTYVYCKIDAKVAFERMQKRGRESGRIDIIGDKKVKLQELENEKKRFDYFAEILRSKGKNLVELDMTATTESIANDLISQLNIKK